MRSIMLLLLLLSLLLTCAAGIRAQAKLPVPLKPTLLTPPAAPPKLPTTMKMTTQAKPAPTIAKSTAKPTAASVAGPTTEPSLKGPGRTSAAQLDISPGLQVTEGDRVTVRCSGIYPQGPSPASFLELQLNETITKRTVRWRLTEDTLIWTNWTNGKADRSVQMKALFVLRLELTAAASHNGLKIRCSSDDASSTTGSVAMEMSVRNAPKVLDCFSNPPKLMKDRAVKVTCTVLEGNPPGSRPSLQTFGSFVMPRPPKETFGALSAFAQRISRFEWTLRPRDISQVLRVTVAASNEVGANSVSFSLQPAVIKPKADPGKLVLFPDSGISLHVGDVISCRLTNGSKRQLSLMVVGQFKEEVLASAKNDAVSYKLEQKFENKMLKFYCKAQDQGSQIESNSREKMIFAKNHRVFLDILPGSEVQVSQRVTAECFFLPAKDPVQDLTLSVTTPRNKFVLNFNGSGEGAIISNDFGARVKRLRCGNLNGLWQCRVAIANVEADDFGASISCLMKNGFRTDSVQQRLSIKVPPYTVILSPRAIDMTSPGEVEAKCLVQLGNPEASRVTLEFEGGAAKAVQLKRFAVMKDRNGLAWQLLTLKQNLSIVNAGRKLVCRAVSAIKNEYTQMIVNLKTPLRFLNMTPANGSVVASGTEVRCAVEGYPRPSLTMVIGYMSKSGSRSYMGYFTRVQASKVSAISEEIRYPLSLRALPPEADIVILCKALQGLESKELRHVFRRSPEDTLM